MKFSNISVFDSSTKTLTLINSPIPDLKDQEILIKNEFTTLCRSDLYTYSGMRKEKNPTILGHEIIGRIESFGPNSHKTDLRNNTLKIGDRVTWAIYASDPTSDYSKRGMPQKSTDLFKYGHEQFTAENSLHGGLSEYCILRKNTPIIKIDESIPLSVSTIINCAVATVAGSMRIAGDLNGKKVMICGTGMLGIVACAMAKTFGASSVIAVDTNEERLKIALEFGANEEIVIQPGENNIQSIYSSKYQKELSIDTLIDFSGSPDAMETCIEAINIGGIAVFIGATFPQRKITIDAEKVVRKILTIKGLHNYNEQDFINAVNFIETSHKKFPFEKLIHEGYNLLNVKEAFGCALEKNKFRVGIHTTING